MRRTIINLVTVVSLVLCLTASTYWARSYWLWDGFSARVRSWDGGGASSFDVYSTGGGISIGGRNAAYTHPLDYRRHEPPVAVVAYSHPLADLGSQHQRIRMTPATGRAALWHWLGFSYAAGPYSPSSGAIYRRLTVPHWALVAALAVLPGRWCRRQLRQRRWTGRPEAERCCLACGYDLRATPDRCPECGAVSESAARTAA